ncbi:RelE/StbE replicon stabilization toxin [Micromonospora sp. B006]|nr:RelE/StbE replicon stabilization toxin [Micromonospora sp. B006]
MTLPPEPVFAVRVDRAAAKLLRKLDRPVQARLVDALASWPSSPVRPG